MASLVHVLESFRSGSLSRENLFAAVDQILATEKVNEAWLLKTLEEENTRQPLPEDVRNEVIGRIEKATIKKHRGQHDAAMTTDKIPNDLDENRTQLATSLFLDEPVSSPSGSPSAWGSDGAETVVGPPPQIENMAMKGTGDVLNDRFVLEECIGAGGMSTVYKALDRRKLEADDRNPHVAVKVLNVEFRAHPDSLIALQREAKKSQNLAHPNIVRVYDFDRDGSTVYMTMEYLPGKSLARILRAPGFKGLPEDEAMQILDDVARALIFAHENGIIHADFKPANVILTDTGKVKVIDFGIARAFRRPEDTDMEATRFDPGSLGALTPTYASPEMLEHLEPDPRDDVYALACITYEMLTGRHPFGRMQATEARDGGLELKRRHLTRRQWKALKAALVFDRDKRTPSIRQFLADIRPERTLLFKVPVYAMANALALTAVGLLGYLFVLPEITERNHADTEIAAISTTGTAHANLPATGGAKPSATASEGVNIDRAPAVLKNPVVAAIPPSSESILAAVRRVIDKVPCAAFDLAVKDGVVNLGGYVSPSLQIPNLEKDLLTVSGVRKVTTGLKVVNQDKCAVIDLLAPYRKLESGTGGAASIKVRGKNNVLTAGDPLIVDISTPDHATWVNIDYFSLDGGVLHMLPGPRAKDNQAPANYKATIGDLGEWTIAKPFGSEMLTMILTPKPLFTGNRDEYEKQSDYLAAVRKRLEQISQQSGKDSIAVDFVMIDTKPRASM